jgi:hypothetical protein
LSPLHVPVSGYVLHPHVALTSARPRWRPDEREVARVLEVRLGRLLDRAALAREPRSHEGRAVDVPYFDLKGFKVWGATAMVLSEFLAVLGRPPDPWSLGT